MKASSQPRDAYGHFISENSNPSLSNVFKKIINPSVSKTKDEDTLIDIHVNNPLKRIVELLQEIKRQKAFSFTLVKYYNFLNQDVYITGQYDSCSQILKISNPADIQIF